jgi:hypothetical protein
MFWFKSCPKCGTGDLYDSGDLYGAYVACLQCGDYLTEAEEVVLRYVSLTGSWPRRAEVPRVEQASIGRALAGVR